MDPPKDPEKRPATTFRPPVYRSRKTYWSFKGVVNPFISSNSFGGWPVRNTPMRKMRLDSHSMKMTVKNMTMPVPMRECYMY